MKKLIISFLIFLPFVLKAQFAVVDVSTDKLQFEIQSYANQIQGLTKAEQTIQQGVKIIQTGIKAYNTVQATLALEQQIQYDLKQVKDIVQLKWATFDNLINALNTSCVVGQPLVKLPDIGVLSKLFVPNFGNCTNVNALYSNYFNKAYNVFNPSNPSRPTDILENRHASYITKLSAADISGQNKLAYADFLLKISQDIATKAYELQLKINTPGAFSMTHAERLAALKSCQDMLIESKKLEKEGNEARIQALTLSPEQAEEARIVDQDVNIMAMRDFMINYSGSK